LSAKEPTQTKNYIKMLEQARKKQWFGKNHPKTYFLVRKNLETQNFLITGIQQPNTVVI
jgi:hypothetical protein